MSKQKNTFRFLYILITLIIASCATNKKTNNPGDLYPGMEILRFSGSLVYVFPNEDSEKLTIVLGGYDWLSVLGVWQDNTWVGAGLAAELLQELRDTHTILIPEKFKRMPGTYHGENMEDREQYTAENVLECFTNTINSYLKNNTFSSIVLVGYSENAMLLPLVYEKLNHKDKVTAMVSVGYGGLSRYESLDILSNRSGMSQEWINAFNDILNTFDPERTEFPDSFEEDYYGMTQRFLNSSIHIRLFDYYKNINIPVFFIHGIEDHLIAVESTFYLQDNLPDKPFVYRYFLWSRQPENEEDKSQLRKRIAEWIIDNS